MNRTQFLMGIDGRSQFDRGYDWTEWGARDRHTKEARPYGYSEHFVRRSESHAALKTAEAVYHDRMMEWDYKKFNEAQAKGPKERFTRWSLQACSEFLTAYFAKPITCVALSEGCNVSSGYPYWVFWFREANAPKTKKKARRK